MNHLFREKSPYLLQHKDNPVNWYPWNAEAFAKAAQEDKPIFLSIGYSTCHWCHVMAHESFEDQEVAGVLNADFICIKVDREERPDIDAVYMAACQAVTGSGGWPLTLFLTPDQKPFFAGTYFPKHSRYGQPGLLSLLQEVTRQWKHNRRELLQAGSQITEAIAREIPAEPGVPDKAILEKALDMYRQQFDSQWGGFSHAPKFPVPHNLLFLIYYSQLERSEDGWNMAEQTLRCMAQGGIRDHVGGGFSRYSTDETWLVPHFEKMLYDNGLLALAYLEAYRVAGEDFYAQVAAQTLQYMQRELTGEEGEFFCGQDADSEGVEGKYYVFTPEEVEQVLGPEDGNAFCRSYGIIRGGNFEGRSIPNRIGIKEPAWEDTDVRLKKLYDYRLHRAPLHKDDKAVLSWNGWAITAMAKAAQVLREPRYLKAAVRANTFIETHMTDKNGRLFLRWRQGEAAHEGQLDDYAVYGLALLELYQSTYEPCYLKAALCRASQMLEFFEDTSQGGFFLTALDGEQLILRPKETYDGALPSGNSAALVLLSRLAAYTGDPFWQEASQRQLAFLTGTLSSYPPGSSFGLLSLLTALYPSKQLICVTQEEHLPEELHRYLADTLEPNLFVLLKTRKNQHEIEDIIPSLRDYPIPSTGTVYYLCRNGRCMAPETVFDNLELSSPS